MKRHHSQVRRRPRRDELGGVDDGRVTAPAIEQDLALRTVRLSDVRAKGEALDTRVTRERIKTLARIRSAWPVVE